VGAQCQGHLSRVDILTLGEVLRLRVIVVLDEGISETEIFKLVQFCGLNQLRFFGLFGEQSLHEL